MGAREAVEVVVKSVEKSWMVGRRGGVPWYRDFGEEPVRKFFRNTRTMAAAAFVSLWVQFLEMDIL